MPALTNATMKEFIQMRNGSAKKMCMLLPKCYGTKKGSHVTVTQFHELVSITNELPTVVGALLSAYD